MNAEKTETKAPPKKNTPKPKSAPKKTRRTKQELYEAMLNVNALMATGLSKSAACESVGINIPSYNRQKAADTKKTAAVKKVGRDAAKPSPTKSTDPIATIQNSLAAIQLEVATLKALGINIKVEFKK